MPLLRHSPPRSQRPRLLRWDQPLSGGAACAGVWPAVPSLPSSAECAPSAGAVRGGGTTSNSAVLSSWSARGRALGAVRERDGLGDRAGLGHGRCIGRRRRLGVDGGVVLRAVDDARRGVVLEDLDQVVLVRGGAGAAGARAAGVRAAGVTARAAWRSARAAATGSGPERWQQRVQQQAAPAARHVPTARSRWTGQPERGDRWRQSWRSSTARPPDARATARSGGRSHPATSGPGPHPGSGGTAHRGRAAHRQRSRTERPRRRGRAERTRATSDRDPATDR